MFDERTFIAQKQNGWQDLAAIVSRVKSYGLRRMPAGDLARLGSLYRRASADLAYSRTQKATPDLVYYLNDLVGDAHGVLYVEHSGGNTLGQIGNFFIRGLPELLRRRMPFIAAAFLLTVAGAMLAYLMVRHDPGTQGLFIPEQFRSSADAWKQGFADSDNISAGEGSLFSSSLMTHNTEVGIFAFATGIATFIPPFIPIYLMLDNGFILGALIAIVQPTGHLGSMWPGLLPHGVCELSAIFICGGAGFLIGWSLVSPGRYTRRDALIANGKEALLMLIGTIPLFIIAGVIEGNVSHTSLPHWAKYTLAAAQFLALAFYIYGAPRKAHGSPAPAAKPL